MFAMNKIIAPPLQQLSQLHVKSEWQLIVQPYEKKIFFIVIGVTAYK